MTFMNTAIILLVAAALQAAPAAGPQNPAGTAPTGAVGATAPNAQLASPRWWLRAAAEHAAGIAPQAEAGVSPARGDLLAEVLWLQVKAGDVEGAVAAAKRHAPQLLRYVAHAQAVLGDTSGALATVGQIADAKEKRGALGGVADSLITSGKLADARRVLNDRPEDELTANLYEMLAQAQAKAGDVAGTEASIKGISDAPVGDGLNDVNRAAAHVALAAAQARAGNRQAYRESLATARQLTQGIRPPYEVNTLVKIARAQADAGDYEAAAGTLSTLDPKERARFPDLVLAAQVKRGDVPPAQALAKVFGHSPVYEAAMEVQLAAKDHKAAAQTIKIAKEQHFLFSEIPTRIVDGFLTAADVDGAVSFVEGLTDPVMRAQLYGHIAARRADAGDPSYQSLMVKAIASAMHVVDQRPGGASARPGKSEVLGQLAQIQAAAKDFEGAKKTIATIEAPEDRRRYEVRLQLRARELAAAGRLEEARAWVASLPNAEDRAQACRAVGMQLMPTPKRP